MKIIKEILNIIKIILKIVLIFTGTVIYIAFLATFHQIAFIEGDGAAGFVFFVIVLIGIILILFIYEKNRNKFFLYLEQRKKIKELIKNKKIYDKKIKKEKIINFPVEKKINKINRENKLKMLREFFASIQKRINFIFEKISKKFNEFKIKYWKGKEKNVVEDTIFYGIGVPLMTILTIAYVIIGIVFAILVIVGIIYFFPYSLAILFVLG